MGKIEIGYFISSFVSDSREGEHETLLLIESRNRNKTSALRRDLNPDLSKQSRSTD